MPPSYNWYIRPTASAYWTTDPRKISIGDIVSEWSDLKNGSRVTGISLSEVTVEKGGKPYDLTQGGLFVLHY
jgi:hypothetical protein